MKSELPALKLCVIPHTTLALRLVREIAESAGEVASGPASYLRVAFLPDRIGEWFPIRCGIYLWDAARSFLPHPLRFTRDAISPDEIGARRRRRFRWTLIASGILHSGLIGYLFYVGVIAPLLGIKVVDQPYRKFDSEKLLSQLRYPPGMLRITVPKETLTLEEIRARDLKRRQEEKARREKAERERLERERAERERLEKEKAEAEKRAAEEAAKAQKPATQFGEINTAPIRDLVGKIYSLYEAGGLDIQETKFTVQVAFRIERDGSLSAIRITKSSGSKQIDKYAAEILWNIGESHALGPIAGISSTSIQLDLTDDIARISITGFAPTPDEAQRLTTLLTALFKAVAWVQKGKNPEIAELMSLVKVRCDNKRIEADLSVSRTRAAAMMRQQFGKSSGASQ
jgi:hypothetical protein